MDESKKPRLAEAFDWFNTSLKGHEFAALDHFTIADLTLLVTVSQCEAFGFEVDSYNRVKHWLRRCKDYMAPYDYEVKSENFLHDTLLSLNTFLN